MSESLKFRTVFGRSLRRLCPSCGGERVFLGLLRVKERCGACGFNCRPEGGYYIGAIYINYGITALLALGIGFAFAMADRVVLALVVASAVAILYPLAFFQISRSLWLGIDFWITRRGEAR